MGFARDIDKRMSKIVEHPPFTAIPRNRNLPRYPPKSWGSFLWEDSLRDSPASGAFSFDFHICLSEPSETIERYFRHWLREQKRLFGLGYLRPDKDVRNEIFKRDLVVFAMSRPPRWSIEDIEVQLKYLGLPPLIRETAHPKVKHRKNGRTSDPKAARREIVRRFTRLLRSVQESILFVPHETNVDDCIPFLEAFGLGTRSVAD
jgi:hypothetical protein